MVLHTRQLKTVSTLLLALLCSVVSPIVLAQNSTPLSGHYTLNNNALPSDSNFISFSSLADSLNLLGINGPVTIDVISTANQSDFFYLNHIQGTSSSNTITINGNGNHLWHTVQGPMNRATIYLDSTQWVIIDSLYVESIPTTSNSGGIGVWLTNYSNNNQVVNCTIKTDITHDDLGYTGLAIAGRSGSHVPSNGKAGSDNKIINNKIIGGYYGIALFGGSNSNIGNLIANNQVVDAFTYGIFLRSTTGTSILENEIYSIARTNVLIFEGILDYQGKSTQIIGNRIHTDPKHALFVQPNINGIRTYQSKGTINDSILIANNIVYNFKNEGNHKYVTIQDGEYLKFIHNTIVIRDRTYSTSNGSTIMLYTHGTLKNVDIQNNIFYLDRDNPYESTHILKMHAGLTNVNMDHNVYYSTNTFDNNNFFAGLIQSEVRTLADWQSSSNLDQNSIWEDPQFKNITSFDFMPESNYVEGTGADFTSEIPYDIFGILRTLPTDPGAIKMVDSNISIFEENLYPKNTLTIYPNPAHEIVFIKHTNQLPDNGTISVYNLQGLLIQSWPIASALDVSHLCSGIYVITTSYSKHTYKLFIQ